MNTPLFLLTRTLQHRIFVFAYTMSKYVCMYIHPQIIPYHEDDGLFVFVVHASKSLDFIVTNIYCSYIYTGNLAGLNQLGLMKNVRYIGGISGGAWASSSYTYTQNVATDEEFLGEIVSPGDITYDGKPHTFDIYN